jgi:putative transposase
MKKSRFTETQIVSILKQADAGMQVKDLCRQAGISVATYYQWKSKYGGLEASELRRVKELEAENAKLKRMYAEMALDNAAMKDLIAKNCRTGPEAEASQYLMQVHARPLRRSCDCVGLSRAAFYRTPLDWTVRDAELIAALAKLIEARPSRGFWKCRKLLRRSRPEWNHKRIYRVYKAMRLNLRRAAKRRLPKRERVPLYVPRLPDTVWSADFMSDALACGRRFPTSKCRSWTKSQSPSMWIPPFASVAEAARSSQPSASWTTAWKPASVGPRHAIPPRCAATLATSASRRIR